MARFMKESTNIPNLQPDVAIFALKHALQDGKFRDKLSMKNPSKIADVQQMVDAFIRTEEFNKAAARLKGSSDSRDTKMNQSKPEGSSRKGKEKVGVDYFSKWIEAEAVSSIIEPQVRKFIWENIITRFDIPRLMVFDHGKQFDNTPLQKWCKQFGIHLAYSALFHPQSNGQAEAANKLILNALKKRVEDEKSKWLEELPGTLWSLRTTEKEATGQTPFHLVYGSEVVIPVEIGPESLRIQAYNKYDGVHGESNDQLLSEALDLLDEARNDARTFNAAYLQRVSKHYNRRVNARPLKVGHLVLRNAAATQKGRIHGKLSATWEGPYIIHSEKRAGTFMLKHLGSNQSENKTVDFNHSLIKYKK
ncbi:uncharacterized protein [Spinacia oleracea]|uniref:Integrase catalytic domain-containing protein n=1 Tax=Spinacia oleracea TaxID=3562 RepID=A0ABM3RIV4_SPIOL|nr:uncharacterized protein LOC130470017 [Spinacia oleracea]